MQIAPNHHDLAKNQNASKYTYICVTVPLKGNDHMHFFNIRTPSNNFFGSSGKYVRSFSLPQKTQQKNVNYMLNNAHKIRYVDINHLSFNRKCRDS